MTGVLFVCLGNICRSPAAQGVFTVLAREAGLLQGADAVRIDSAGTGDWHVGHPPDPRMIDAAARRGIDIAHLRARQVTADDLARFDYVLAMDRANLAALQRLAGPTGRARPALFLSLADALDVDEVPDPYYGGADGFERCLDLITAGAEGLVRRIRLANAS
ncbi:MAG: low molecular weight phosphotyrosine protein phosphatase [Alphaproteobacteria bacterium]|nr:MAG: low molecular weight phosphotyrosine protein phosphatase [Alphaproteobacteria bacterium]